MNNAEIIKALEYCINNTVCLENCEKCPYKEQGNYCMNEMLKDCLNLIKRQQAVKMMTNKSKQSEHLFSILKELLDYPAIAVEQKEDGTINLLFDGCCECDIEIKNYIDLRYDNTTETGGEDDV